MAYNTKDIIRDKDGNPIAQYFNPETDSYEPLYGVSGANRVILYNKDGTVNDSISLVPILDKLSQLTGTVIDEQVRQDNELQRIEFYNQLQRMLAGGELKGDTGEQGIQGETGKGLEYHWRGTELGVRIQDEGEFVYVDLKGDTGSIENLTKQHIVDALEYTPVRSVNDILPDENGNLLIEAGGGGSGNIYYDNNIKESDLPNSSTIKQGITLTTIITGGTQFPTIPEVGSLITYKTVNDYVVQQYVTQDTGVQYVRRGRATLWDEWSKQATEGYVNDNLAGFSSEIQDIIGQLFNDVGTKVSKSGDTMSGTLVMNDSNIYLHAPDTNNQFARQFGLRDKGGNVISAFGMYGRNNTVEKSFIGKSYLDTNLEFYPDKTQVMKPLEEVFEESEIPTILIDEEEFNATVNSFHDNAGYYTFYKQALVYYGEINNDNFSVCILEGFKGSQSEGGWQKLTHGNGGFMSFRHHGGSASSWSEWYQVATNEPIPWISATFSNGWMGSLQYRINALGQLEIKTSHVIQAGVVTQNTNIASLPVGFRPKTLTTVRTYDDTGGQLGGVLVISSSGTISIRTDIEFIRDRHYIFTCVIPR